MQRGQVSQQLVFLLGASGALGGSGSAFQTTRSVRSFLDSNLTLPLAGVRTLEAKTDHGATGRVDEARFRISVVSLATTEVPISTYVGSGGDASSEQALEITVPAILAYLQGLGSGLGPGMFTQSAHGFQGYIENEAEQALATVEGNNYVVTELDLVVTDCTQAASYAAPFHFSATPGAGHTIALAWTNPATRFDQYQNVLCRGTNPGDPAPTTPSGGTPISITGGVLGTSATDTLAGSGLTYNYALFRTYNAGTNVSSQVPASATTT